MLDIAAISLNPAIDETIFVDNFQLDSVNRSKKSIIDVGGKGINVASFLNSSKLKVASYGFLGKENSSIFDMFLNKHNILNENIKIEGKTRVNLKIVDEINSITTDINQEGFYVEEKDLKELEEKLFSKKIANWYVFSGSLPLGVPEDIYKSWIEKAKKLGAKTALDSSKNSFKKALEAKPNLIKPNIDELGQIYNKKFENIKEVLEQIKKLSKEGIETICVSLGDKGALLLKDNSSFLAEAKKIKIVSTVGAGDAMLSGLIVADINNLSTIESIKLASAYSVSALQTIGPYLQDMNIIKLYAKNINAVSI